MKNIYEAVLGGTSLISWINYVICHRIECIIINLCRNFDIIFHRLFWFICNEYTFLT